LTTCSGVQTSVGSGFKMPQAMVPATMKTKAAAAPMTVVTVPLFRQNAAPERRRLRREAAALRRWDFDASTGPVHEGAPLAQASQRAATCVPKRPARDS